MPHLFIDIILNGTVSGSTGSVKHYIDVLCADFHGNKMIQDEHNLAP